MTDTHTAAKTKPARVVAWRARGLTFREIGDRLGASRLRVQQIDRHARQQKARPAQDGAQ
jgi:transcriptional regulator